MILLKYLVIPLLGISFLVFLLLLLDTDYQDTSAVEKAFPQQIAPLRQAPALDSVEYRRLLALYGKNKKLPSGYEWPALIALAHYPELKDIPIEFIQMPTWIPLSSRPHPWRLLFPWQKRVYLVVISTRSEDFLEPILLHRLPLNCQVGVIGHELAHTVYYLDKSALQLAGVALGYLSIPFRKKFEKNTDRRAIAHGLGYFLYDYAVFVRQALNFEEMDNQMAQGAEDTYLSPEEIKAEMKKNSIYRLEKKQ
ncbi:MAG: hypothetical protein HC913_14655 [Microscillaceae bacterium]|nr:hypothetical protein [Microscillaceae bacterium]